MSIIGEGFSEWMRRQVQVRQQVLGSGFGIDEEDKRFPQRLSPFLNSSPWIRMASSVNLINYSEDERKNSSVPKDTKTIIEKLENDSLYSSFVKDFKGNGLAKNFVLHNGVTKSEKGNIYSGIREPNSSNIFGGAYGFGSKETIQDGQGYVPMPGIESVDFKYKNDGALSQASVKIKAYSQFQFQLIDILFQRPGYTVLLEFGHSVFLDNAGNTQYAGEGDYASTKPFELMFQEGGIPQYKLATAIQKEKQKWYGNYEANFMRITKFSWSFNSDGTYDITCNLIGLGDVINSIKANVSPNDELKVDAKELGGEGATESSREEAAEDNNIVVSEAIRSRLNFDIYRLYLTQQKAVKLDPDDSWLSYFDPTSYSLASFGKAKLSVLTSKVTPFPLPIFKKLEDDGNFSDYNPETDFNSPRRVFVGFKEEKEDQFIEVKGGSLAIRNANNTVSESYDPTTYMTFGLLLALITKNCNMVDGANNPLTYFNFNFEDLDADTNYMKTFPGHFSADPNICIIPPTVIPKSLKTLDKKTTEAYERQKDNDDFDLIKWMSTNPTAKFAVEGKNGVGRLACVYLDINFVSRTLKDNIDQESMSISIVTFLNQILSGINSATGGINDFRVMFNESTHMIDIISQVPMDTDDLLTEKTLTTINTFGVNPNDGSFVTDVKLNAELTDDFASVISIGAQNNGNTTGTNAGSFALYNYGLIDRMTPVKQIVDPDEKNEGENGASADTVKPPNDPLGDIYSDKVKDIFYEVYDDFEFTSDYTQTLKGINADYCKMVLGLMASGNADPKGKSTTAAPFFLPFNLSLTMHGISGLKIFQAFKQDGKILPPTFDNDIIQLIIKSYSHNVSLEGWKTSIETISKPIFNEIVQTAANPKLPVPDTKGSGNVANTSNSSQPTSDGTMPEDPNGTLTSGYPLKQIYYNEVTNKTQIYLHHTAGRQNIRNTIHGWNQRTDHVATHYITNNEGEKEQLFADEFWANHLGLPGSTFKKFGVGYKNLNRTSLGIELSAAGGLKKRSDGTYRTWFNQSLPLSRVARAVDKNGRFTSYKGYEYYEKYSPAQIQNIEQILLGWMAKYNIPFKYDYDILFTQNRVPLTGKSGIYTHNSVRRDKFDVFPQKELIDMLKSISS